MSGGRALAYGRKSFDDPERQTSSVGDQRHFAEAYAERHGLELVGFHGDDGITGATMERPGLQAMLAAVRRGGIDALIIEDVDRLGRDQEHLQHMMKILRLHDVTIHTVAAGVIDDLVFAFKGIIGEQQRKRIAYTTRRGLKGKAQRGGVTGGRTLGYARERLTQPADGRDTDQLVIVAEEAELVRRIFELYASGLGLKAVCAILNADGIPSPRSRESGPYGAGVWNPTTLSGDPSKGEGILNNETYIGRRIFNRRTWVEVPNEKRGFTRKPRLNPEADWVIRDEPALRIVDQALWDRVKARQTIARAMRDLRFKTTGSRLAGGRERQHLLSGLVECGACGRPYISSGAGRWRCKGSRANLCNNGSITAAELERRALAGVQSELLAPDVIARFAAALQVELKAAWQEAQADRQGTGEKLATTRAKISKILAQIEGEDDVPRTLMARLRELEAEEVRLADRLAQAGADPVIRLPANYEAVYRQAVDQLGANLAAADASASRNAVRVLIEKVVVHTGDGRGGKVRAINLHGDLFRMLEFVERSVGHGPQTQQPRHSRDGAVVLGMVAGTGFEPVTFRL